MARENLMSLKAVPLQFAEFKPVTFTPAESNLEILNRSMEKIDAREKESIQAKDVMSTTLNEIRSKLNPEEFAKFDEKAQQARDEINTQIELGRYGLAMSTAYNLGRSFADDTSWQNKIKAQEAREKAVDELKRKGYSQLTIDRYLAENKYYDDNTGTWEAKVFHPVDEININELLQQVVRSTPEQGGSHTTGNDTTKVVYQNIDGISFASGKRSSGRRDSTSTTGKYVNDMRDLWNATLNDPRIAEGLKQQYENKVFQYNRGLAKLQFVADSTGNTQAVQDAIDILSDLKSTKEQRDDAIKILTSTGIVSQSDGISDRDNRGNKITIADINDAIKDINDSLAVIANKDGIYIQENDWRKWADRVADSYFEASKYVRIDTTHTNSYGEDADNTGANAKYQTAQEQNKNAAIADATTPEQGKAGIMKKKTVPGKISKRDASRMTPNYNQ